MRPKARALHRPARATAASNPPDATVVEKTHRRLARRFGPLDPPRRLDPLEELVLTVLSQNTSDVNRDRAYASLSERFASWDEVAEAAVERVADAIRPGGLANTKAPRIQAILRSIEEKEGRLDLGFLHRMSDEEATAYLISLPGVGPKTAACVLAFSLDRPALPVDTHVHRVATRLGYLPPRTTAEAAHAIMERIVRPKLRVTMHVALIRLGREICKPGRPRCEECPLQDLCPTAPSVLSGRWRESRATRASERRGRKGSG